MVNDRLNEPEKLTIVEPVFGYENRIDIASIRIERLATVAVLHF
jgi:hypothetical protein